MPLASSPWNNLPHAGSSWGRSSPLAKRTSKYERGGVAVVAGFSAEQRLHADGDERRVAAESQSPMSPSPLFLSNGGSSEGQVTNGC